MYKTCHICALHVHIMYPACILCNKYIHVFGEALDCSVGGKGISPEFGQCHLKSVSILHHWNGMVSSVRHYFNSVGVSDHAFLIH